MLGFHALTTRLADTRFGIAALALTLAAAPACGKKSKGTDAPDSGGAAARGPKGPGGMRGAKRAAGS